MFNLNNNNNNINTPLLQSSTILQLLLLSLSFYSTQPNCMCEWVDEIVDFSDKISGFDENATFCEPIQASIKTQERSNRYTNWTIGQKNKGFHPVEQIIFGITKLSLQLRFQLY